MKKYRCFYIVISSIIFIYVFLRALLLEITYDEAWTIDSFVQLKLIHILNYTPINANNHILNTLLIKLFISLFGDFIIVSRLPNLIAFAFYLFYSYKISSRYLKPYMGIILFIALFCNPFLLDFFSLARGYGIALAFMISSLYYLIYFVSYYKLKTAYISLILASFSVLSNFPFLNYWLGVFFIIHFSYLLNRGNRKRFFKLLGISTIVLIALAIIIYEPIRKLVQFHGLYYGGNTGFFTDTLTSLTAYSLNQLNNHFIVSIILILFLSLFLITITLSLIGNPFQLKLLSDRRFFLLLLLLIPILSSIVQFHVLGNLYLIDRAALFYYPLFIIVFVFWANDCRKYQTIFLFNSMILIVALIFNQIININIHKTITWDHDSQTTEILSYLNDYGKSSNRVVKLDSSWPFQSSIAYYINRNSFKNVNYVKKERYVVENNIDFYMYYDKPLLKVGYDCSKHPIHNYEKDTILQFPIEGIYLFQLK